ncbi:four-carbon acid sugar kinase family protein [Microvirga arabica]|uniref:Four-carbon acid sugar kinase family protein n=1 Tax=Microvirga arabica TaxID=1128671 RepID=A0ABV6YBI2_9HYPH|nr:four-carbon acid sugar kinase family protein [Microvirga arabica]MBM1174828.1 four-carbon acid sugar kinase family protein [Microvirga arabica]
MIETLIIADDLTGAADCAVSCVTAGAHTVVLLNAKADPGGATAVSVDVNSRAMMAQEAGTAVTGAVQHLYSKSTRILYHKIDSTLRGNWPSELAHIRQAVTNVLGHAPLVIVAPAFPGAGRATIDGQVFVNGNPLGNTDLWKQAGLTGSGDLRAILEDVGFRVGMVTLEQVALGSEALKARLAKWADAGCDAVVCDAQTEDDLLAVAAAILMLPGKPLWVGSAGLMRALVRAGEGEVVPSSAPVWAAAGRPILVVVGSASSVSRTQFDALTEEQGVRSLTILPSALRESSAQEQVQPYAQALDAALASGADVAVTIGGEEVIFQDGPQLAAALAELIAPHLSRVGGLIVTGGETARAILDRAGISGLRMQGEIEPGAPIGASIGDITIPVITKAGAFGDAATLKRCRAFLRGDPSNHSNSAKSG